MTNHKLNLKRIERSSVPHSARPARGGFSLIEVLVVVALSSLLLGIVVSLIFGLRQWDQMSRTNSARNEQLLRLAGVLREDIRGGSEVLVSLEGPLVVMTASGEQLRYELQPEGCRRTVSEPGRAKRPVDLFAIGKASKWIVKQTPGGRRPLVEVTLEGNEASPASGTPRRLPFLVCAALGADTVVPTVTSD